MRIIESWIVITLSAVLLPTLLCAQTPAVSHSELTAAYRSQQLYRGIGATQPVQQTSFTPDASPFYPATPVGYDTPVSNSQYDALYESTESPAFHTPCDTCDDIPLDDPLLPFGINWENHRLTTSVIPGSSNDLGMTSVELKTQLSLEQFPIVQLTPRMAWNFPSAPDSTDVPRVLYEHALDLSLFLPINNQWTFYGGVSPGLYTDHDNVSSDSFRLTGRALFFYKYFEELKLSFGVVYLDREDIVALPAVGLTYSPASMPDWKFDITFPRPKISYRFYQQGEREKFLYLGGRFGGGTWAIERKSGLDDVLTYRDLQLSFGFEDHYSKNSSWFLEAGFAFSRSLEYTSGAEFDLSDTGLVRAGLTF